jgi:hypothetical protein
MPFCVHESVSSPNAQCGIAEAERSNSASAMIEILN